MSGTINTIPAAHYVSVVPSVVSGGGVGLDLLGLMLSTNTRTPIGTVLSFPSLASVQAYYGATSAEATWAQIYFLGYTGATKLPGALLVAQYPTAAVGAYLRGGNVASLTLAQLNALSGSLTISINGTPTTYGTINLAGATSNSSAAQIISTYFTANSVYGPTQAVFTASLSAIGGATMTVSAVASGTLAAGQAIRSGSVTSGTYIVSQLSGTTGGVGNYSVNISQTVSSQAVTAFTPAVTYDTVSSAFVIAPSTTGASATIGFASNTLSAGLKLTQALGAVTSQGADIAVPATFMSGVIALTQNWATFFTTFDPDGGSGNTNKLAFAAWVNGQNNRYAYNCTDNDVTPTQSATATSSLGYILNASNSSGTAPIYEPLGTTNYTASFLAGFAASVNFGATNGRATAAYKSLPGLTASVTTETAASNLEANHYNYYGAVGTANDSFRFLYPGLVTGQFAWFDSYINQIWLNNASQLALLTMLRSYGSIPYNPVGYNYIRAALADPINAALNSGVIRENVPLSAQQASIVNALAGQAIDSTLATRGWYLVIQPATAQVRAARGSPTIILLYMDGGSVQKINLSSVLVQ